MAVNRIVLIDGVGHTHRYEIMYRRLYNRRGLFAKEFSNTLRLGEPKFISIKGHDPFGPMKPCQLAEPSHLLPLKVPRLVIPRDVDAVIPASHVVEQFQRPVRRTMIGD